MLENAAAWLPARGAKLDVKPAPYTPPGADEIVVGNHAVAINPFDWIIQAAGNVVTSWIKPPFILGSDVASEVVEIGSGVTRFQVGDRVIGHAVGTDRQRNRAAEGAFQRYTVLLEHMTSPIPDTLSFDQAVVLPLTLSTAACGLFEKDQLALRHPSLAPDASGETLIVWGGSTSVGSNAIQLAVAAGYEVITTSSPRNADYVKRLGASQSFDYRSETVVSDIVNALRGKQLAGALAIGKGSADPCVEIVHASTGRKFVALTSTPVSFEEVARHPNDRLLLTRVLTKMGVAMTALGVRTRLRGVQTGQIFGSSLLGNEVGPAIYRDFLPGALAQGCYVCAPEPMVVGHGLEAIQAGIEAQIESVSARKIVVTL